MVGAPHPYHPDCPNSLNCLPDTHEKPNHILPVIVRSAILGSPKQKLTIREIYKAIENKFPYFRTTEVNWKVGAATRFTSAILLTRSCDQDSIRHNLSLNKLFEKVPRPLTDPGIGSYWTVNIAARGAKRPRKRKGRPSKDVDDGNSVLPNEQQQQHDSSDPSAPMPPPPPPHFDPSLGFPGHPGPSAHHFMQGPPGQGMPPGFGGIGDDGESDLGDATLIDPSLDPSLSGSHDDGSIVKSEPVKITIVRLRQELSQAKHQYTLATQESTKLAEQLAEAQDEAKKIRLELADTQAKLDEEVLSRIGIERKCQEAEEARVAVEERLGALTELPPEMSPNERPVRNENDVDTDLKLSL